RTHRARERSVLAPAPPPRAGIARAEDLTRGRAEVELHALALAGVVEGLPEDREVGLVGGSAAAEGPRRAGIARLPDTHGAVRRRPVLRADQRDHIRAVLVGRVDDAGEAEGGGKH